MVLSCLEIRNLILNLCSMFYKNTKVNGEIKGKLVHR